MPRHFDKMSIQRQIMSNRILPALVVQLVVAVLARYVRVDLTQRKLLLLGRRDRLRDQLSVRIRRFFIAYYVYVLIV